MRRTLLHTVILQSGGAAAPPVLTIVAPTAAQVLTDQTVTLEVSGIGADVYWQLAYSADADYDTVLDSGMIAAGNTTDSMAAPFNASAYRVRVGRDGVVWDSEVVFSVDAVELLDEFTDTQSAPIASPRTPVPIANGHTAVIKDTTNKWSIDGTMLDGENASSPGGDDPGITYSEIAFAIGWQIRVRMRGNTAGSGGPGRRLVRAAGTTITVELGNGMETVPLTSFQVLDYVRETDEVLYYADGVLAGVLPYHETVAAKFAIIPTGGAGRKIADVDYVRQKQLAHQFASDYGTALLNANPAVSGTEYEGGYDGWRVQRFTRPASPASGDRYGLDFRYLDDDNRVEVYIYWNTGTSKWSMGVRKIEAGTPTALATDVADVGSPVGIMVAQKGNDFRVYTFTATGSQATARFAEDFQTALSSTFLNTETTLRVTTTNFTLGRLTMRPRTSACYAYLEGDPSTSPFLAL